MRIALALVVAVVTLGAACDDSPNIGDTCTADHGCHPGVQCDTRVPHGYCTVGCVPEGPDGACPAGAYCASLANQPMRCVLLCDQPSDCRSDLSCTSLPGSDLKACLP